MAGKPDNGYTDGGGKELDEEEAVQWPPAPPTYGHPDAADGGFERPPFVLIDPRVYFADRKNGTTAVCGMEAPNCNLKGQLQVTFCAVAPPLVSYFCVHATHMDHTEFAVTPFILATETDGGLVLLCVVAGDHPSCDLLPRNRQYFVYDALSRKLHHLPLPGHQHALYEPSLAIMRKPKAEPDHFIVAAQAYMFWGAKPPHHLCIYDSATNAWSKKPVVMGSYPEQHFTTKTLTIGGSNGTVAWVDLWRNIVFCDVLVDRPKLSCLDPPCGPGGGDGDPRSLRDITVVGNIIKYVEMLPHPDKSSYKVPSRRWLVAAWSIKKARHSWPEQWNMECKLDSTHIKVDSGAVAAGFPSLSFLHVGLPTLSLQNDAIVYFLAKTDFRTMEGTAWVLAVDTENDTVEQVAEFPAERTFCLVEGYVASRISAYLQPATGTQQIPK